MVIILAHISDNWPRSPFFEMSSESELFTGDTSKDNHSPGPVIRGASP